MLTLVDKTNNEISVTVGLRSESFLNYLHLMMKKTACFHNFRLCKFHFFRSLITENVQILLRWLKAAQQTKKIVEDLVRTTFRPCYCFNKHITVLKNRELNYRAS